MVMNTMKNSHKFAVDRGLQKERILSYTFCLSRSTRGRFCFCETVLANTQTHNTYNTHRHTQTYTRTYTCQKSKHTCSDLSAHSKIETCSEFFCDSFLFVEFGLFGLNFAESCECSEETRSLKQEKLLIILKEQNVFSGRQNLNLRNNVGVLCDEQRATPRLWYPNKSIVSILFHSFKYNSNRELRLKGKKLIIFSF